MVRSGLDTIKAKSLVLLLLWWEWEEGAGHPSLEFKWAQATWWLKRCWISIDRRLWPMIGCQSNQEWLRVISSFLVKNVWRGSQIRVWFVWQSKLNIMAGVRQSHSHGYDRHWTLRSLLQCTNILYFPEWVLEIFFLSNHCESSPEHFSMASFRGQFCLHWSSSTWQQADLWHLTAHSVGLRKGIQSMSS